MFKIFTGFTIFASLLLFGKSAHSLDRVIVVYNSDPKAVFTPEDTQSDERNYDFIKTVFAKEFHDIEVERVAIESKEELERAIIQSEKPLRGIIFLGHGNQDIYALNSKLVFSGDQNLPKLLGDALMRTTLSHKLVLYFGGCMMGRQSEKGLNFQESLYRSLVDRLPEGLRSRIEVIAHANPVEMGTPALTQAGFIERFFYKSGIGHLLQRFDMIFTKISGPYGPTLANFSLVGAAVLGVTGFPEFRESIVALMFGTILLKNMSARSLGLFGHALSSSGKKDGSVRDLFNSSITKFQCSHLF